MPESAARCEWTHENERAPLGGSVIYVLWSNVYHVYLVYINYNPFLNHDYGYAIRCMANQ